MASAEEIVDINRNILRFVAALGCDGSPPPRRWRCAATPRWRRPRCSSAPATTRASPSGEPCPAPPCLTPPPGSKLSAGSSEPAAAATASFSVSQPNNMQKSIVDTRPASEPAGRGCCQPVCETGCCRGVRSAGEGGAARSRGSQAAGGAGRHRHPAAAPGCQVSSSHVFYHGLAVMLLTRPDTGALPGLEESGAVAGVILTAPAPSPLHFISRYFAPWNG